MHEDFINWIIAGSYFIATLGGLSVTIRAKAYLGILFVLILAAVGFPVFWRSLKALRGNKE